MRLKDLSEILRGREIVIKYIDNYFNECSINCYIESIRYLSKELLNSQVLRIDLSSDYIYIKLNERK